MAKVAAFDMTRDLAPLLTMTVSIIGLKKWHLRFWFAIRLIRLAAIIMNVGIKFEEKPIYDESTFC